MITQIIKITESKEMVKVEGIRKTLWQRLFSWPWNPLCGQRTIQTPALFQTGPSSCVCHPAITKKLVKMISEEHKKIRRARRVNSINSYLYQ